RPTGLPPDRPDHGRPADRLSVSPLSRGSGSIRGGALVEYRSMGPRDRLPFARRDPGLPSRSTGFRVAGPGPRPLERTTGHGPRGVVPHRPGGPSDPASRYAGGVADLGRRDPLGPRVRGRASLPR